MSDPSIVTCKPPSVLTCDAAGCRCDPRPLVTTPVPQVCPPATQLQCSSRVCVCVPAPDLPIVHGEPAIPDGCTVLFAFVFAGLKKTLLGCWVNG